MSEEQKDYPQLMPTSLLTPEYVAWSNRAYDATIAQFKDPDDVPGTVARELFDRTWPVVESLESDDGTLPFDDVEEAREHFAVAIQEFVNGNVGIYKVHEKEETK